MKASRILIVDDEVDLRELIAYDLDSAGFETAQAENGKVALDMLNKEHFDGIVSDIRMPVMDGVELLRAVRKTNQTIVMVFITGFSDITMEDALEYGIDGLLHKPFDRRLLVNTVTNLLKPQKVRWKKTAANPVIEFNFKTKFPTYEEAVSQHKLKLARGGLFVAMEKPSMVIGSIVSFKIEFEDNSQFALEGQGIVRWVRTQTSEGHLSGAGLEFQFLTESSISFILQALGESQVPAFIPKG